MSATVIRMNCGSVSDRSAGDHYSSLCDRSAVSQGLGLAGPRPNAIHGPIRHAMPSSEGGIRGHIRAHTEDA